MGKSGKSQTIQMELSKKLSRPIISLPKGRRAITAAVGQ